MILSNALRSTILNPNPSRLVLRNRPTSINSTLSVTTYRTPTQKPCRGSPRILTSSSGSTTVVAIVAATVLSGSLVLYQKSSPSEDSTQHQELVKEIRQDEEFAVMAGTALPGRPGNLTAEQEIKLQELWTILLNLFGVPDLSNGANGESGAAESSETQSQTDQRSRAGTAGSEKKNKKRVSLFGRKKHDGPKSEEQNGAVAMDGEDKFGQTKDFHRMLDNQSPEDLRQVFWSMVKHDNPDGLLLRFLRARKWNVQNALIMLMAAMHWRMQEMHLDDDIVRRGEGGAAEDATSSNAAVKREGEDFLAQLRLGKSFLHGTDKAGRPMCFVRVRLHKQGEQSVPSLERFTVYTIETARLLLDGSDVDTATVVFDMTDFSLANMDYGPVKFMINCFEANYPESLGAVLVHKSPWVFHSIWKIIKGWLDPVVASKVHFTKNIEELEEFVERNHIPTELGGDEAWEYKYVEPNSGENETMKDEATRERLSAERAAIIKDYETTTQQWIHEPQGKGLQQKRAELTERLKTGYWQLDPYLRAKTIYDRTGMIRGGGQIQYYENHPARAPASSTAAQSNGPPPAEPAADDLD